MDNDGAILDMRWELKILLFVNALLKAHIKLRTSYLFHSLGSIFLSQGNSYGVFSLSLVKSLKIKYDQAIHISSVHSCNSYLTQEKYFQVSQLYFYIVIFLLFGHLSPDYDYPLSKLLHWPVVLSLDKHICRKICTDALTDT